MPRAKASKAASDTVPKVAAAKRGPKAQALAKPLPAGEVLHDLTKKGHWKLVKPIGQGGFGLIYLAHAEHEATKKEYVVKLEPHNNGPLFCELNFFRRAGKPEMIADFKKKHRMKHLGIPPYVASGTHNDNQYRFMVMPKYATDLQKLFEANGKIFPESTVYNLGIQMVDALEYVHSTEFVHADIKASNILLDGDNTAFLVDYGLATRYILNDKHKEYKEDPRKAHDGTIEFTSRDAHRGVAPSRRADFEILAYCLLQWRCRRLPWEDKLSNKDYVAQQKIKYLDDLPSLFRKCFPGGDTPVALKKFLEYVVKLKYDATPDYDSCRGFFTEGLKKTRSPLGKLVFNGGSPKKALKNSRLEEEEEEVSPPPRQRQRNSSPKKKPVKRAKKSTEEEEEEEVIPLPTQRKPRVTTPKTKAPVRKPAKTRTPRTSAKKSRTPRTPAKESNGLESPSASGDCVPNHVKALPRAFRGPKKQSPSTEAVSRKRPRCQVLRVDEATQTSPGLRGLRRSRRS